MVANFGAGGAAINVLARQAGADVLVVDVGVATPFEVERSGEPTGLPAARRRCVAPQGGAGHRRPVRGPGHDPDRGAARARRRASRRPSGRWPPAPDACITGDMGIGNTTPSAALIAAFTGRPGGRGHRRGAGADDAVLARKVEVVERRRRPAAGHRRPARACSAEVGGLEIAALAGFIIGGAAAGVPVIIDGVIAAAAAVVAVALSPDTRCRLVAGHRSVEPGATAALDAPRASSRCSTWTCASARAPGAILALPLLQASARILRPRWPPSTAPG